MVFIWGLGFHQSLQFLLVSSVFSAWDRDEEGWEEVRRKRGKAPATSGPDTRLNLGGTSGRSGSFPDQSGGRKPQAAISGRNSYKAQKPIKKDFNQKGNNSKIKFTVSENAKKNSYSEAVKIGAVGDLGNLDLECIEPKITDGKRIGSLSSEAIKEAEGGWDLCILLYVVGYKPWLKTFEGYANRVWATQKPFSVHPRNNGFFVVRFGLEEDCSKILKSGPWFMDRNLIIMKRLSPEMKTDKDLLTSLPMWVRLPGLSFKLWGNKAIIALMSTIGVPIKMDEATKKKTRLAYARVLIEVNVNYGMPNIIEGTDEEGRSFFQEVEYENPPPICDKCVCFGHAVGDCPMTKSWVPKQTISVDLEKENREEQIQIGGLEVAGEENGKDNNKESSRLEIDGHPEVPNTDLLKDSQLIDGENWLCVEDDTRAKVQPQEQQKDLEVNDIYSIVEKS